MTQFNHPPLPPVVTHDEAGIPPGHGPAPAPGTPRRAIIRGFSMMEMLVVIFIITILLSLTVGAISAYQRFQYDRQTRQELATLDAVVDEYNVVKGQFPNIYGTVPVISTSGVNSGIQPASLATANPYFTRVSIVTSGTSASASSITFDEPYAMTHFLSLVEGVGGIGYSGMLDASGLPSTASAVPASGMLAQLSAFTTVNLTPASGSTTTITYKHLSYTMTFSDTSAKTGTIPGTTSTPLPGMALYRDAWDRYIWYAPSTNTSSSSSTATDPTTRRPTFGSVGSDTYYSTSVSTSNGVNTPAVVTGRDDIISAGGAAK